mmetsp:Transcript_74148/g.179126  ORF Transcript_74148/g.179126 Transcript_74148/m.179126 type:complete len:420 (-) Transcript_74148:69-1328(-)
MPDGGDARTQRQQRRALGSDGLGPVPARRARAAGLGQGRAARVGRRGVPGARVRPPGRPPAAGGRHPKGGGQGGGGGQGQGGEGRGAQVDVQVPRVLPAQGAGGQGPQGRAVRARERPESDQHRARPPQSHDARQHGRECGGDLGLRYGGRDAAAAALRRGRGAPRAHDRADAHGGRPPAQRALLPLALPRAPAPYGAGRGRRRRAAAAAVRRPRRVGAHPSFGCGRRGRAAGGRHQRLAHRAGAGGACGGRRADARAVPRLDAHAAPALLALGAVVHLGRHRRGLGPRARRREQVLAFLRPAHAGHAHEGRGRRAHRRRRRGGGDATRARHGEARPRRDGGQRLRRALRQGRTARRGDELQGERPCTRGVAALPGRGQGRALRDAGARRRDGPRDARPGRRHPRGLGQGDAPHANPTP